MQWTITASGNWPMLSTFRVSPSALACPDRDRAQGVVARGRRDDRAAVCSRRGAARQGAGLDVWKSLPAWEGPPPAPPRGSQPVEPREARLRLAQLIAAGPNMAEARPTQSDYASAASQAFAPREQEDKPNVVLVEAGTGVGKTLGYVAPASLWAEKNGAPVWIATYTRNLQRQIDNELDRLHRDSAEKRRRARQADIVTATPALVMAQAAMGGLDDATRPLRYVFDEGHHLFDAADGAFGAHLSGVEASDLRRWLLGAEGRRGSRARGLDRRLSDLLGEDAEAQAALRRLLQLAQLLPSPNWQTRLVDGP